MKRRLRPVALGLLQGPAELLPISSSAHARILGGHDDKALEVALHAGSLVAFLANFCTSTGLTPANSQKLPVRPWFAMATVAPPSLAVLALGDVIEHRLGTPRAMALGLLAGSALLVAADRATGERDAADASLIDAVGLGLAQALALWPGVSRSAATLTAARARGFTAQAATALSREALLPVLAAATARKATAFRASHLPGFLSAAVSTYLSARILTPPRSLKPYALYRTVLAIAVLWEDRHR